MSLRPGPREPESEAGAPLSDLVGGRGTGSRAAKGAMEALGRRVSAAPLSRRLWAREASLEKPW